MIEDAAIRKAREDVTAATADRWGCIRIRRTDILDMLDLIAAQDAALDDRDRQLQRRAEPRFADRLRLRTAPAPRPKRP